MLTLLKSSDYLIYCSVLTLENPVSFYRVYLCVLYWMLKQTETEYVVYGIKGFIL